MTKTDKKKQQRRMGPVGKTAAVVGAVGAASAITVAARRWRGQGSQAGAGAHERDAKGRGTTD